MLTCSINRGFFFEKDIQSHAVLRILPVVIISNLYQANANNLTQKYA
jgi:hypothetical protein